LSDLVSWTSLGAQRYFSGTAIYRANITAPTLQADESACLSFKAVHEIATITVNGTPQPPIWAAPYTSCFTNLRSGLNNIEIAVTNLWRNRFVGDAQPSNARRATRTNIKLPDSHTELLPSGLIGDSKWLIFKKDMR
jgi:hypothetical protein